MDNILTLIVSEEYDGLRIDKFLSENIEGFSRAKLKELLDSGEVTIADKSVKASRKVAKGEEIRVKMPEIKELEIIPEDIPLDIIYQDRDLAIINKPAGMCVHPANGNESGTMVNALLYHVRDLSTINGVIRPGIVHRIDMGTSGLLVVAKNDIAHNALAEQFAVHSITREYTCVVHGTFTKEKGTIIAPIGRDPHDRKKMAINHNNGKHAVTHYTVYKQNEKTAVLKVNLETGRTHQIRVHMASTGHPIVGDPVYGRNTPIDKPYSDQLLHAGKLGFIHPTTKEYMEFESEMPGWFYDFAE
ncbi:MAG: RluA family pseudouridine synthase [Anaerofustis stercorihominis]|nr:RluA family pseudouridine synthase [Anaerofustis stercorihominis]